ncbi:ABC transporter permease [Candidatus Sumerlaeota bacterium]|nr:ABC transporter permease [Candidatus Sumerlaeota bacterium]
MRFSAFRTLLRINLRGRLSRHLTVGVGLAVGSLALGLAALGGVGLSRSLGRHLESLFPEQRVVLRPKALNVIWLQVETVTITPRTVEAVRRLPGVRRVSPEATIRFPISAEGSLLGNVLRTDITVSGVEPWVVGDNEVPPVFSAYDPRAAKEIPSILSAYFLDLYNTALAESNHLPKLSPAAVVGRDFTLILGESTVHPLKEEPDSAADSAPGLRLEPCRIAGLSRNPDLLGLLIPLAAVETFNRWYGYGDRLYRAIHAEVDSPQALEAIREDLDKLGLAVFDRMGPWRKVLVGVEIGAAAFVSLGALVFGLAIAYMLSSLTLLLSERGREIALFQALGATRRQVALLLVSEIAVTAALGVVVGLGAAVGIAAAIEHGYQVWRETRAFLPETLFAVSWVWIAALGLACWLAAVGTAWARVRIGVRRPVATELSKVR